MDGGVSDAVRMTVEQLNPGRAIRIRTEDAAGIPACRQMIESIRSGNRAENFYEGMGCVGGCVGGPKAVLDRETGRENVERYGDATGMAEKLKREVFPDVAVGVLHGRMPREERDAVMERFRAGAIKVLFATSVIEVGLDVPAACIMLVQHAERFGLSQLHQMRGRIGRGKGRSYFLVAGEPATEEASKRLEALVSTTDGFKIAEMDLALRGPGEFFSDRQHGGPDLRLADLSGDRELLDRARETANRIAEEDRMLKKEEHAPLRALVRRNYKGRFLLGVTG